MHAIRQHAFGPAERLEYTEVPDPVPGAGQVRIAVDAAGVHLLDTMIRRGAGGGPFPLPDLPMTPGREVAGRVDAAGPEVDAGWIGRRVVAHLGMASGGYASAAVAPVAALHEIPGDLSAAAAVAMIGTGRTAVGILDLAKLTPSDAAVVTAAAGGLGGLLVQGARRAGAAVVGLAGGPGKVARVEALGVPAVDYRAAGWPDRARAALGGRPVTVLLDGVAGEAARAIVDLLAPGGRIVNFGWSSGTPLDLDAATLEARGLVTVPVLGPALTQRPGGLRSLETEALAEAAAGRLVPLINPPFPLADAAAAHRALENRATYGKVVLVP
ncbi:MAG TPA: zinc-binding dehydrogenase [Acidimicrobiales bacterium]|nr:zinc-binding dehydrogenase [Acidimicrobiales bacterium]